MAGTLIMMNMMDIFQGALRSESTFPSITEAMYIVMNHFVSLTRIIRRKFGFTMYSIATITIFKGFLLKLYY